MQLQETVPFKSLEPHREQGKTRLADELIHQAQSSRALVLKMKFSTYEEKVPLSAFNRCLNEYVGELSAQPEEVIEKWQKRLLKHLGDSGSLIKQRLDSWESSCRFPQTSHDGKRY